jgi:hypothetical protein
MKKKTILFTIFLALLGASCKDNSALIEKLKDINGGWIIRNKIGQNSTSLNLKIDTTYFEITTHYINEGDIEKSDVSLYAKSWDNTFTGFSPRLNFSKDSLNFSFFSNNTVNINKITKDSMILSINRTNYFLTKLTEEQLDSLKNPLLQISRLGKPLIGYKTINPKIDEWVWNKERTLKKKISVILKTKISPDRGEFEKVFYEIYQKEGKGYYMFTVFYYLSGMDTEWIAHAKATISQDGGYSFEFIKSTLATSLK